MKASPRQNERDFSIKIKHIPTGRQVTFIGWVTAFSDSFTSTWNPVQVYGRMDPLSTFQGTQRKITIGFDVIAESQQESMRNDNKMNQLIQFLYPVYDKGTPTTLGTTSRDESIIAAAPLLQLRYANLVQNNGNLDGLIGYLDGVDYAPTIESGQFFAPGIANQMYYQQLSISLSFTVLHTHLVGWVKGEDDTFFFGGDPGSYSEGRNLQNFPHGGQFETDASAGTRAAANQLGAQMAATIAENAARDQAIRDAANAPPLSQLNADETTPDSGATAVVATAQADTITEGRN
jgi:hypothetical protein